MKGAAHKRHGGIAYLVQQAIGPIHCNSQDSLLSNKAARGGNGGLAVVASARLCEDWVDLGPVAAGGLIEGGAEQPVALWVAEEQGDSLASYMEIGGIVIGGVDGDTTAGGGALGVLAKGPYRRRGIEGEVSSCEGGQQEEVEESHLDGYLVG